MDQILKTCPMLGEVVPASKAWLAEDPVADSWIKDMDLRSWTLYRIRTIACRTWHHDTGVSTYDG